MNSYSLMNWHGRYIIVQTSPDNARKSYLQSVRNGATVWFFDPMYARPFSKKTAMRHIRDLRASDPECQEDF